MICKYFLSFYGLSFHFFGGGGAVLTAWHAGSQFPGQGLNPRLPQWKYGVLSLGQSGKTPLFAFLMASFSAQKFLISNLTMFLFFCKRFSNKNTN